MKVRFFNPGLGYLKIKKEVDKEIQRVLNAGDLILREDGERFEQNLANFVGTKYAVGLNSGTDALYLSLKAIGVGQGDEVITSSHTFVATAQVIAQLGAIPVLVDIDEDGLMDLEEVKNAIIPLKTRAIIPVHIAGDICDMVSLKEIADHNKIWIIEDAAQALGAVKPVGSTQCFSFYPAKILGAYGDAGAITTNEKEIYNEIKELRNHYKKDYSKWGINSRLDNLQAAILNIKIKYLPEVLARRKEISEMYLEKLNGVGLPLNNEQRVWQDFIIRTEKRNELYDFLKENGIETMKNEYPFTPQYPKLPMAQRYEEETLRLPCNENLTDEEIQEVINKIKEFYSSPTA